MMTYEKMQQIAAELCAEDIKTRDDVLFVLDKVALDPENLIPFESILGAVLCDVFGLYDKARRCDPATLARCVSDVEGPWQARILRLAALRANVLDQLIRSVNLGPHLHLCLWLQSEGVAALRALLMLESDAPAKPGPSWETELEVWRANLADFPRAAPLPQPSLDPDVLDFGVSVVEAGDGAVTLSMKIGPASYTGKLRLPVDAEKALARHLGGLGRMTIAHDDTGDMAEKLAGARSEIARLRTLLDVLERNAGMRAVLVETSARQAVVCAASSEEQRIADMLGSWAAEKGFLHPRWIQEQKESQRAIQVMGSAAARLLGSIRQIAKVTMPLAHIAIANAVIAELQATAGERDAETGDMHSLEQVIDWFARAQGEERTKEP